MKRLNFRRLLNISFFVISICYSISFLFLSLGFGRDTFYWISKISLYNESFMVVGTLWLGYVWTILFGDSLLSVRVLSWIISESSLLLFYFVLMPKTKWLTKLPLLSTAIILMGSGSQFFEFSPTSVTVLLLSIIAIIVIKYIQTNLRKYLYLCAMVSSFAIACRFPNIVCIIMVGAIIVLNDYSAKNSIKKIITNIFIYTITTFILYYIIMVMFINSFDVFGFMINSFKQASSGSHSMSVMIGTLQRYFILLFNYIALFFFFGATLKLYKSNDKNIIKLFFTGCLCVLFIFLFVKSVGFHKWNNIQLYYFLSAISISLIIYFIISGIEQNNSRKTYTMLSMLLIGIVAPLGSDTGWYKLFPMFVVYLPILLYDLYSSINKNAYSLLMSLHGIILLFTTICYIANPITPSKTPIPLWKNTIYSNHNKLKGIFITPNDNKRIDDYVSDYNKYSENNNNTAIYGSMDPYTMIYICNQYNNKAISIDYSTDFDDNVFVDKNDAMIKKDKPTIFVVKPFNKNSLFYKNLIANKYKLIKESTDNYVFKYSE